MATLSCAMVGPMDGIYLINASRIMQTCRGDGIVLKPDRPLTTTDWCFSHGKPTSYIYHTYSDLGLAGRIHYLFNNEATNLEPGMVYMSNTSTAVVYNWYTQDVTPLVASTPVVAGYEGFSYAVVSPVFAGGQWAFIGEPNKYTTACRSHRFDIVSVMDKGFVVQVTGAANETVTVCAAQAGEKWTLVCKSLSFGSAGQQNMTFSA